MENIVNLKDIEVVFEDGERILKKINLDIKDKEFVTFLGPSGCGKTTILREILPKYYEDYLYVSQKPLKGNSFTTVATYTKLLGEIRTCSSDMLFFPILMCMKTLLSV